MSSSETRFAVLLFSDIVGSTDLKSQHGAMAYLAAAELHNALFERFAAEEKLTLIKNTGDGYLARTESVAAAVRFALRLQDGLRIMQWPSFPLATRVGIHAGEVADTTTLGQADILGPAADLAARVMNVALGGQILLSRFPFDEARHFLREHPQIAGRETPALVWLAHGPYLMKGRDEPMEIFEVGAEGLAPLVPPPDGEKVRRAIRPGEEETLGWRPAVGLEVPGRTGWLLMRKIGEGGFGEVWLAEQAKMKQRRVFKFCFDEERLRSFKRELTFFRLIRDALGERADIAKLYDVKLDEPPFFLESEFAEHGNLTEWSATQGGIGAVPMERRLEIVAQIAEAVSAAHSVGILHKDLKPQNVLMQARTDGEAAPQITDFGIGALADKSALAEHEITAAGFTVNTLVNKGSGSSMTRLYAPPEQLTGKPYTVQGDVYALGVILYQMVIGDFAHALAPGWEREVKDDLVREDLAECLDGDPARRLTSAAELAERLRSLGIRRSAREAEHRRRQANARRKRNTRLALIGGAIASVIAIGLGAGFFRERTLRQRATDAEQLATTRFRQAQDARDAAEKLVNEAVFGLREKLVPIGKISVLEDLAAAAEHYYAKLPADLISDVTRRHEVRLALNRAAIASATSDDEVAEAAANKGLALARELSAKAPEDESMREAQNFALLSLAHLRFSQERHEELAVCSGQLDTLAADWLRLRPKSPGALRAKLMAIGVRMLSELRAVGKQAAMLISFAEAQGVAEEIRQSGGETMETRIISAMSILARAMLMQKLGNLESAVKLFTESETAFRDVLAKENGHPFVHELALLARRHSLVRLGQFAKGRGDTAVEKEAFRQVKELVAEQTALAEFEPARLERWKELAWLHANTEPMAQKFDGDAAWLAWLEKGLVAAERAASPKADRKGVRWVRIQLRVVLCRALETTKTEGWPLRACRLLSEVIEIYPAPSKEGRGPWDEFILPESLKAWRNALAALSKMPEQRAAFTAQAQAMAAFAQRTIDTFPTVAKARHDAGNEVRTVAALLRQQGCPEAEELEKQSKRWLAEAEEKFPDDPVVIERKAEVATQRGYDMLIVWRAAPAAEKDAHFAELEKHVSESRAYLQERGARISEYHAALFGGGYSAALGTAQLERGDFAAAETNLRDAVARRGTAVKRNPHAHDVNWLRFEMAQPQRRLGQAIFKLGRTDEGRKMCGEAAEALAAIAKEEPSEYRWQTTASVWRDYAGMYEKPEELSVRIPFLLKAADALRELVKLAKAANAKDSAKLHGRLRDAAYDMLTVGRWMRDSGDLKASEEILREGLGYAIECAALATPADLPEHTELCTHLRYDVAVTLHKAGPIEEALRETEQIAGEVQQFEQKFGADHPRMEKMRYYLSDLRRRLPQ